MNSGKTWVLLSRYRMIIWMPLAIRENLVKNMEAILVANKKTFLLIQAITVCSTTQLEELHLLLKITMTIKLQKVINIYESCKVDEWAKELKTKYMSIAMEHLEEIAVLSARKKPLEELAHYLLDREM